MLAIDQVGGADIGRLHALHDGVAGKLRADRLADDGTRAVATDQIAAARAPDGPGVEIAQTEARGGLLHHHVFDRGAVDDLDARLHSGVLEQDRLEKYLVDAMRRLRRRPVAVRAIFHREAIAAARNLDSPPFLSPERGAVADCVRIIPPQTGVSHPFREAE